MFNPDDLMKSIKKDFKKIVENEELELSCDCGHKISKSIRWLKDHKTLGCPIRGMTINLLGNETITKALKSLD